MRSRRKLIGILAAVVLMGVLPGVAAANTTEAIAETGGMTLTIPGVPVTVSVTLDQFGNIDTVGIADAGFVATRTGEHKMRFSNGTTDGSTEIRIEVDGEELGTELRTLNFADVLGDNVWTGDIFGTGDTTTVTFTVVQACSGSETYAEITSVVVDTLFDFMVDGPETELTGAGVTFEAESEAEIEFFFDGFLKTLEIEVETEFENDDDHRTGDRHERTDGSHVRRGNSDLCHHARGLMDSSRRRRVARGRIERPHRAAARGSRFTEFPHNHRIER